MLFEISSSHFNGIYYIECSDPSSILEYYGLSIDSVLYYNTKRFIRDYIIKNGHLDFNWSRDKNNIWSFSFKKKDSYDTLFACKLKVIKL